MKRLLIAVLAVALLSVFAFTSIASAQQPTPSVPGQGNGGWGRGMMGGGMMGGYGAMHDYMFPILAEKLGLTVEELNDLYASGENFWTVAESQGLSVEQAQQIMLDARNEALDKMVADGVITQEQADWMKSHMGQGHGGCHGGGPGGGRGGHGGMMGGWRWSQDS